MAQHLAFIFLDSIFLMIVAGMYLAFGRKLRKSRLILVVVFMLILTAIFDNLLIVADTFRYNPSAMLGWKIGLAPLEDFGYTLATAILMPVLWELRGRRRQIPWHDENV